MAAISGPAAGTDIGIADYSVGDASAVADGLNALATDDCAVVAAADVGLLAAATDFPNAGAIAIPATGSPNQIGPASPYPSTITVSGMTGVVSTSTCTSSASPMPLPRTSTCCSSDPAVRTSS